MLVLSLSAFIVCLSTVSLRIVDSHMRQQMNRASRQQFRRSLQTFEDAEAQRLSELERQNALMADLPSLKALMTTADDPTIEDGGRRFKAISGNDLFALATRSGHIAAAYTPDAMVDVQLREDLEAALNGREDKRYLVSGPHLFGYSVQPVFFGDQTSGTLIGYVISGYSVDASFLHRLEQASGLDVVFLSHDRVLASTLRPGDPPMASLPQNPLASMTAVTIGSAPFTAVARDLSSYANAPLRLLLLRSMRQDEADAHEIDRLLALIGLFTGLAGAGLMLLVSAGTTHSLRALARGVEAFGEGNPNSRLPQRGPREVRQLSAAFAAMRGRIEDTNRALLEAERLATIGRMARSVSHDLRHYLSAVYANAEFLASAKLTPAERSEFFEEIRAAVLGTTDMIDSLLLFSRTGKPAPRKLHDVNRMLQHAIEVMQHHPEAESTPLNIISHAGIASVACDNKQIERALCNLLLNATHAARTFTDHPLVSVSVAREGDVALIRVSDNGGGVPESVRERLFQPFVSEGKQSGTGLGLTLALQVARDHGGDLVLESSVPGATCFCFSLFCSEPPSPASVGLVPETEPVPAKELL